MTLDPRALEAAKTESAIRWDERHGGWDWNDIQSIIQAYLDAANLVPLSWASKQIGFVEEERDEARAQVAALRAVITQLPESLKAGNEAAWDKLNAVLTDTAEAAAQYQLVPKGHVVVPDNDNAVMAIITSWPIEKKKQFYIAVKAMLAAAAKPEPEDGG